MPIKYILNFKLNLELSPSHKNLGITLKFYYHQGSNSIHYDFKIYVHPGHRLGVYISLRKHFAKSTRFPTNDNECPPPPRT